MKKDLSPAELLQALADAWRKHPGFGAWHWYEGKWYWLTNHGDARTRCGSPIPTPKAEDVKPHERELWKKCWKCGTIRPWGGCGSKFPEPRWIPWGNVLPEAKPKPELKTVDSPAEILVVLEGMTDCAAFGEWLAEDEIASFATQQFDYKINVNSLLKLLRPLWREGKIEHKRNADGKNTFRLTVQEK